MQETQLKNIRYITFDTIDSTQFWVRKNAAYLPPNELTCVTAHEQTAAFGRFNRTWVAPKGENIYATLYFTLPKPCPFLAQLAQLLSLSCAHVLKNHGFDPAIKWPNDILLANRKTAGILCEILDQQELWGIALGIGINVNMDEAMLNTIDQPATSLHQISGRKWDLNAILTPLIFQFLNHLHRLRTTGFAPFQAEYNKLLAFKGETIGCHLHANNCDLEKLQGTCLGIDSEGRLELQLSSGKIQKVTSHDCTPQKT